MVQKLGQKNRSDPLFRGLFAGEFTAGFSGRSDGNMSLNYGEAKDSPSARANFLQKLGIDPGVLVCAQQTHSCNIRRVGRAEAGYGAAAYAAALPDTDSLITNVKELPLAIFTADCLSVFLFDPSTGSIGLVHAGWKGTQQRITEKTVQAMAKEFRSRPESIVAAFGPAIRSCCYKVGEEFEARFPGSLARRGDERFLDLAGANRRQLSGCGVKLINILDCGICTFCHNSEFFSYRKEGSRSGRMMSVMMLT